MKTCKSRDGKYRALKAAQKCQYIRDAPPEKQYCCTVGSEERVWARGAAAAADFGAIRWEICDDPCKTPGFCVVLAGIPL
jgi:hypothetical protein